MANFVLEKIDAVRGVQTFEKLIMDGKCLLDDFERHLEKEYRKELTSIYANMNSVANLQSLPRTKYHFYDEGKDGVREFEFKTKHLRVYGITKKNGKIIILGGTKASQKADTTKFRSIKIKYLSSL